MSTTDLRREDSRLLRGVASYVADVHVPDALSAAMVRSSFAYGAIRSVDVSGALAVPGVHAVMTAADLPVDIRIPMRRAARDGMEDRLQPVLAREVVRYVGEPIAVVVADDPYIAEVAADLVEVEIEPLQPATSVTDVGPGAPGPWDGEPLYRFECAAGDVDDVFAAADVVVDIETIVERQTGLPMETRGVLARWIGDELELWGPAKFVHYTTRIVAELLGLAPGSVRSHRVDVGGMFGTRGELYPEDLVVPIAARHVGRPVRWVEDRREHLLTINHSRGQHHTMSVAASADGELQGFRATCALDVGAYARPIGARLGELVVETLPGPYRWTDYAIDCTGVLTNKTPTGTMRGPSGLEANHTRERLVDLVAHRIGMDAVELRRRNLITPADLPFVRSFGGGVHDVIYDGGGDYPAILDQIVERAGEVGAPSDGRIRSRGVGAFVEASGIGAVETAEVELTSAGRFRVGTTASEIGQGLASMLARVAGDELGIPTDLVDVELGDSAAHDGGSGTYGSRTTIFVGSAVVAACRALRDELCASVAAEHDIDPSDVSIDDLGLTWAGGFVRWSELPPRTVIGEHRSDGPTFGFGAVVADLEIDPETGQTDVAALTVGYDCGQALDPRSVEGQLRGAAVQGLGGALLEALPYDDDGQPLATTFMDYLVPTCSDAPAVEVVMVESGPVAGNPLGVKGVGEAGLVGVGAAVANAVAAAGGGGPLRVERLPKRPQEVAEACGARPRDAASPPPVADEVAANGRGRPATPAGVARDLEVNRWPTSRWVAAGGALVMLLLILRTLTRRKR